MCQNLMDSIRVVMYSHFISLISNAINTEKYSIEKILILILKKISRLRNLSRNIVFMVRLPVYHLRPFLDYNQSADWSDC